MLAFSKEKKATLLISNNDLIDGLNFPCKYLNVLNNQTNSHNITFYTNFCKIISKLISYSFDNANIIIYSRIIDIMIILSNEKVFIDYFMENSIDSMNLMMFKGDFKYSISFTVRGIVLFQNIISFFYMHPSYVAKNIIQINKILLTPKLLCDSNYFSKKEIRIQLAILLRNCLNFFILFPIVFINYLLVFLFYY